MKLRVILLLLFFSSLLVGQKNEVRLYSGIYNYDWLENPRNRYVEGNASIYGLDYSRIFFAHKKMRFSYGAGIRNFRSKNFKSAFTLQDSSIEIRNVITNSYYFNILFKAEAELNKRVAVDLIFNNLFLLDKKTDFIHQNRFHNNLDIGLSYALNEKISLGVTSQINLFPIGSIKGSKIVVIGGTGQSDFNIKPGGLGISAQLMYKF